MEAGTNQAVAAEVVGMASSPQYFVERGERFGQWLALTGDFRRRGTKSRLVRCECECGRIREIPIGNLVNGLSTRCKNCASHFANLTHGQTISGADPRPEYTVWVGILARTVNASPKSRNYRHYAGRGISVCERWQGREGFENFLLDMGPRPSPRHSIDRYPDFNGNYEKSNCRWATWEEQANNKRSNRRVTIDDRTLTLSQWARATGKSRQAIDMRLRSGWPIEDAILVPIGEPRPRKSESEAA